MAVMQHDDDVDDDYAVPPHSQTHPIQMDFHARCTYTMLYAHDFSFAFYLFAIYQPGDMGCWMCFRRCAIGF